MSSEYKDAFLAAVLRAKKTTICFPATIGLQSSELAVMHRAAVGCSLCEQGQTVSEIQRSLHISKPAVSQVLNNLEKKGYIVRAIDSGDRRKITVTLTSAGEAELKDAVQWQNEVLEQIFRQIGDENIRTLVRLMNRLMDILDDINLQDQSERCESS